MDEKYLEILQTFYDEKVKFLSNQEKFSSCNNCEDIKLFKETKDKLIFSCGGKDNCGTQFTIDLAKYLHYETEIKKFKTQLKEGHNWDVLKQHIDINPPKKSKDKIKEAIHNLEELFYENNIEKKNKKIQSFYDNRKIKLRSSKNIWKSLQKNNLPPQQKNDLMNQYVTIINELKAEYIEIKNIIDDMNPYLTTDEGKTKIENVTFEGKKKLKKEKKKKEEEEEEEEVEEDVNEVEEDVNEV